MALDSTKFSRHSIASNGAPSMHTYVSSDTIATITTAGYFNTIAGRIQANDFIFVMDISTPATPVVRILYVKSIASGVVTVTAATVQ